MPLRVRVLIAAVALIALLMPAATPAIAKTRANATDRAFVREMTPHHQMAVEMAEMAKMHGEHRRIRVLSTKVVSAQSTEIAQLRRIAKRLGVTPQAMPENGQMSDQMMADFETLGVSMEASGMMMDMSKLDGASPFDRVFIDMMIPHHQGAIHTARAERRSGRSPKLRSMARKIIRDQAKEIREMNAWRKAWYGATSPAGGVPE